MMDEKEAKELYNTYWRDCFTLGAAYLGHRPVEWCVEWCCDARLNFETVLEIGTGTGDGVKMFLHHGKQAQGIEYSHFLYDNLLKYKFPNGEVIEGDAAKIPFGDEGFDLVFSSGVLEHLPEWKIPQAMNEMHRVCRKYFFGTVGVEVDMHKKFHLTLKPHAWWREQFVRAGFIPIDLKWSWIKNHPEGVYLHVYAKKEEYIPKPPPPKPDLSKPSFSKFDAKSYYSRDYFEGKTSTVYAGKERLAKNDLYPAIVDVLGGALGLPGGAWWQCDIRKTYWYNMRVLDIGCGMGATVQAICERYGDAYGIDVSEYAVKNGLQPRRLRIGAVENGLPWKNNEFDLVYSSQLLEHLYVEDVDKIFTEIGRVLRDDGFFYADFTAGEPKQDGRGDDRGHQTMRPEWWWMERLGRSGFTPLPTLVGQLKSHRIFKSYGWAVLFAMKG